MHCFQTTVGRRARGHLQDLSKKMLRRTHALAPGNLPPFRPPGPLCHNCLPSSGPSVPQLPSVLRALCATAAFQSLPLHTPTPYPSSVTKFRPPCSGARGGAPPLCLPHCSGKKMLPPVFVILPDIFSRMLRPRCGHERSCCGHGAGMDGHAAVTGGHGRSCAVMLRSRAVMLRSRAVMLRSRAVTGEFAKCFLLFAYSFFSKKRSASPPSLARKVLRWPAADRRYKNILSRRKAST